jgi:hypothetical protein
VQAPLFDQTAEPGMATISKTLLSPARPANKQAGLSRLAKGQKGQAEPPSDIKLSLPAVSVAGDGKFGWLQVAS